MDVSENNNKFFEFLFKHKVVILVFISLIIGGVASFKGLEFLKTQKQQTAMKAFYEAKLEFETSDKKLAEKKTDKNSEKSFLEKQKEKSSKKDKNKVLTEGQKQAVEGLLKVARDHQAEKGALMAIFYIQDIFVEILEKSEKAKNKDNTQYAKTVLTKSTQLLEAFKSSLAKTEFSYGLVLFRLAKFYEKQENYKDALEKYTKIVDNSSLKFMHGQALLKIAFIYELEKRSSEEVVKAYQRVIDSSKKDSSSAKLAEKYLWAYEFKKKNKTL